MPLGLGVDARKCGEGCAASPFLLVQGARHTGSVCRAPRLGGDAYFSALAYSLALSAGM